MYTSINFKSKKALKDALKAGAKLTVYAPCLGTVPFNGETTLEGPHYPKPHTWYARVMMKDGIISRVIE
jgi:hypothetical protein